MKKYIKQIKTALFITASIFLFLLITNSYTSNADRWHLGSFYINDSTSNWVTFLKPYMRLNGALWVKDYIALDSNRNYKIYSSGYNLIMENYKTSYGGVILQSGDANGHIDLNANGNYGSINLNTIGTEGSINIMLGEGSSRISINKSSGMTGLPIYTIDSSKIQMISGSKFIMGEGSDHDTKGIATLSGAGIYAGVTVSTKNITSKSSVFLTRQDENGSPALGELYIAAIVPGTSFDIRSKESTETSKIAWLIIDKP